MGKCERCSAPLNGAELICVYCGSRNDIDLNEIHSYTQKQPLIQRTCPSCSMSLQSINIGQTINFFIESCRICKGVFFDNGELEALYERALLKSDEIDSNKWKRYLKTKTKDVVKQKYYQNCPVCQTTMQRKGFENKIALQHCMQHGVWVEKDQLLEIFTKVLT